MAVEGGLGIARALPRTTKPAAQLKEFWRVARWGVFAGALIYCLLVLSGNASFFATDQPIMMADAAGYYFSETPYDWSDEPSGVANYRYSPAFLVLIAPFRLLPWEAFAALWFVAHIAVLLYLRVPWMLVFPGVMEDALAGNINTFLALAVVLIVRRGAAPLWAVFFLTKVMPGVAVVWHAARREWRDLAVAAGVTAIIIGIGVAVDPQLWTEWLQSLVAAPDTYEKNVGMVAPLWLRIAAAAAISAYAATSDRPWLLPVALIAAMPGIFPTAFTLLVASVVLYQGTRQTVLEPVAMAGRELVAVPVVEGSGVATNSRSSIR
ncbi:MAG: glycosyltransferase family 87 protein [Chloroflexota bacterium]